MSYEYKYKSAVNIIYMYKVNASLAGVAFACNNEVQYVTFHRCNFDMN